VTFAVITPRLIVTAGIESSVAFVVQRFVMSIATKFMTLTAAQNTEAQPQSRKLNSGQFNQLV